MILRAALMPVLILNAAMADEDGFVPLFNGTDLSGWSGEDGYWRVEDGAITGSSIGKKMTRNTFLSTNGEYADFVLRVRFKFDSGNSGIQFRSTKRPDYDIAGYQADIADKDYMGMLYDEHGRGIMPYWKALTPEQQAAIWAAGKVGEWNDYEITCQGDHVKLVLNGKTTCDIIDPEGPKKGVIALQIHVGPEMEIHFKDIRIKELGGRQAGIFDRSNLMAWCIVPFDSKQRGPEARAEMLTRMGIFQLAYDWRAEHIPTFDEELETLKRWGIKLSAFWFPGGLNTEAQAILDVLKRHNVQTELWVSFHGGEIACTPEEHKKRIEDHVAALRPIAEAAAAIGCKVGLYNHMGWFGEPENQIEIIRALNAPNVGMVYNLHHGHHHVERFPALLAMMKPYLYCLNLNGMTKDGDAVGKKILPLGNGEFDIALLRTIRDSGYAGPIGILGHTMDDAEETLLDNLDGLDWLLPQLDGAPAAGPRPPLRVGADKAARAGEIEDPARRAALPEYQVIPAAEPAALAAASTLPPDFFLRGSARMATNITRATPASRK